jgi:hypothetical protein
VDSLHSLAKDKSLVEYLFKVDSDDPETQAVVNRMSAVLPCRTLLSHRGDGYLGLHEFINQLSAMAWGDWLFVFNDDARMKTEGWDQVLLNVNPTKVPRWGGNDDICLLGPRVSEREISWEFPILRRKTFRVLGHFSRSYSTDAYIYWVMSGVNAALVLPDIEVGHFVNEIDDDTKREGKLVADGRMEELLDNPEIDTLKTQARTLLKEYLSGRRQDAGRTDRSW